jgi:hypothetical protein
LNHSSFFWPEPGARFLKIQKSRYAAYPRWNPRQDARKTDF